MVDAKVAGVVFFYNQIKAMAEQFIGNLGVAIDTDILMAAIGYWKRNTWWGQGLFYGAIASLGQKGGLLHMPTVSKTTETQAQTAAPKSPGARRLFAKYFLL